MYKICNTYAIVGCGYDHIKKRDVPASVTTAVTTTITGLSEAVATAVADDAKADKLVTSVMNKVKSKETKKIKQAIKILDASQIDFSLIEKPQLVTKVDKVSLIKASAAV